MNRFSPRGISSLTLGAPVAPPSTMRTMLARRPRGPLYASGGLTADAIDDGLHMIPGRTIPDYMMQHLADGGSPTPNWDEYQRNLSDAASQIPGDMARNVWPAIKGVAHSIPASVSGFSGDMADSMAAFGVAPQWMQALPNTEQVQSYLPGHEENNPSYNIGADVGQEIGGATNFGMVRRGTKALSALKALAPWYAGGAALSPAISASQALSNGDGSGVMSGHMDDFSRLHAANAKQWQSVMDAQALARRVAAANRRYAAEDAERAALQEKADRLISIGAPHLRSRHNYYSGVGFRGSNR